MKKALFVALALVASALGMMSLPSAGADGTEQLGAPSIPIADGTGFAVGGTGMLGVSTASFTVDVPAGVAVEQVLLYWEGQHTNANSGDPSIVVNGEPVNGTKIGGRTRFYSGGVKGGVYATAYRADVTSHDLVDAGTTSTFDISGMQFNYRNNGIGAVVIYDDGSTAEIGVFDGLDLAYYKFASPLDTTVPKTFAFTPSPNARVADLTLHVGDVGPNRPNRIVVTSGGVTQNFDNVLQDTVGQEWDAVTIPVDIPADASSATVQLLSYDDPTGLQPASLAWVYAGLAVPPAGPICEIDAADALGRSRAYGIRAEILGEEIIPPSPDTDDPSSPNADPAPLVEVDLFGSLDPSAPTIVYDALFDVEESETGAGPVPANGHALAVANHLEVTIPGIVHIQAETVRAEADSTADGTTAGSSAAGSVIQDLYIDDLTNADPPVLIGDVSEPTSLNVGGAGTPIVQIDLLERIRTNAANGVPQPEGITDETSGVYKSGLIVNGIHVQVPDLDIDVVVSHADTYAQAAADPDVVQCTPQPHLFGEAFTSYVGIGGRETDPTTPDAPITPFVTETTGFVKLPSTGGTDTEHVLLAPPFGLNIGNSTTTGDLAATTASSHAQIAEFDLFNAGFIVGDLITSDTSSSAGGDSGNATMLNLFIGGQDVCTNLMIDGLCRPAANTQILGPPPGLLVMLNEQILHPTGGITVNAIHVWVVGYDNPLGLPVGAEVIISSASSDYVPAPTP